MNTPGKPGWFTKPKEIRTGKRNAFEYILNATAGKPEMPEPEAKFAKHTGGKEGALGESYDWSFALAWEDALKKLPSRPGMEWVRGATPNAAAVAAFVGRMFQAKNAPR
jgi:hypothetical protein